jgi:alpha-glucosidase (family GH31 glycosyl hydrolase)
MYLPTGTWLDLWTKRRYDGGQTITVPVAVDHMPVFVREGSRIPARFGPTGEWGEPVAFGTEPTTVLTFACSPAVLTVELVITRVRP